MKGAEIARKRYTAEQIFIKLREAEIGLGNDRTARWVVRALKNTCGL